MKNKPLKISNITIQPGERITMALPTPELYTCAPMHIPIHVIHGKKEGPCLLVCGAIHGDEMNGVAIIQRLLELSMVKKLSGTLIAVPVVNVYGLITKSRNLPDRRDLEGSFPGSKIGSFAARLAHVFTEEILDLATHIIDLHTGEPYHSIFPQIQTNFEVPEAHKMAKAFGTPIIMHSNSTRGLLWLVKEKQIPTLIYEGGEALAFDELSIRTGVKGIIRVMRDLKMLKLPKKQAGKSPEPVEIDSASWIYSSRSGLCQRFKKLGQQVKKKDCIAIVSDPFGTAQKDKILSPVDGIVISQNSLPIVNEGDPILQVAETEKTIKSIIYEKESYE
ncbi:MAG: succinylglutamate desuccinylase/aspartoacylase family protein [Simkaniaceae bacterium]